VIDGENSGEKALRDAERYVITEDDFKTFLDRHRSLDCLVPESNDAMRYSYLILDEYVSYSSYHNHHGPFQTKCVCILCNHLLPVGRNKRIIIIIIIIISNIYLGPWS